MAFSDAYFPTAQPLSKYDVFISFTGKDTRNGFTSHLYSALCRNQIETFIDNRIEKGGEIWEELVEAIRDSMVYLVIFSEHYAHSKWCLRELVEIMECNNKKEDCHVIPVFYMIEPSHVRKQTGSYYGVFADYERNLDPGLVRQWRKVLFDAANIAGFQYHGHHSRTESDLIEGIIQMILWKLNRKYRSEVRSPFIYDQNYACIESVLTHSKEVRSIGIWGMGGIGKTTIATAIFQEFSPLYEGSCFLANVREESERHGLSYIFTRLLCELLQEEVYISTPKIVSSAILLRLRRKKVFIVLDDVNTSELLENLLGVGHDYLGAGSKVIVTTRDKHVLLSRSIDHIHEVMQMNDENSLKLFSLNAFNRIHPPDENGYLELSKRTLAYAKGIPLALKVLGSFLHSKSEKEWDNELEKLKKIPNADIQKVLRLSFNELDHSEKDIFLDIACFFKGQEKEKVTTILNKCGFYADIGIRNLLDKALISIAMNQSIQMHDLIQEMGHKIVWEESVENPGGRSRVWNADEVCDKLKNDKGTDAIESIFLDLTQIKDLEISTHAFRKMLNLRLHAFASGNSSFGGKRITNTSSIPTNIVLPDNLRYVQWDGCPLKSLSSSCWPTNLVELSMTYSDVEKLWDGAQNLPSLEVINLTCSKRLKECPNLSGATNLKEIWLVGCDSLCHIHPSIFCLQKLYALCVYQCKGLKSICSNEWSPSLRTIVAYDCPNLQEFSVPMIGDHSGIHLHLRSTALKKLPSSVFHLRNLEHFSFAISDGLMDLPSNFAHQIMLSDPTKHEYNTAITLHKVLPSPIFQSVRRLIFYNCCSLTEIPENISLLSSLVHLNLYHCTNVINLPESIKYLPRLQVFSVYQCEMLQLIPILPPSLKRLRVWDCQALKTVLISESQRKDEGTFIFLNCINLDEDSYGAILRDAIVRPEVGTKLEKQEDACIILDRDCYVNVGETCCFLPVRHNKLLDELFHEHSTEASISVELTSSSKLSGFLLYLVLSQAQLCDIEGQILYNVDDFLSFGCECYLETSCGEKLHTRSSSVIQWHWDQLYHRVNIKSDHVLLWYDETCCKKIMETIKGRKAITGKRSSYSVKLAFKFFAGIANKVETVIKGCGIRWIYQNVEEESRERKSKRNREVYESVDIAFQIGQGSESHQQEPIPLTKKFKQSFLLTSPSSIVEAEAAEDLRQKLELLHIQFDGHAYIGKE
ncbi:hypothetical protein AAHE18_U007900 [Arachis hypogaea]